MQEITIQSHHSPVKGENPLVVFPSAYELTVDQEKKLIEFALDEKLPQLSKELGRSKTVGDDWMMSAGDSVGDGARSWMGKRQLYELTYEGDVEWRPFLKGGVFQDSNWNLPVIRRITTQQVARATAHFCGSDPWFSVDVEDNDDPDVKIGAENWMRNKFRDGKVRQKIEAGLERAFVRGEAVLKRGYRNDVDIYESEAVVLVAPGGKAIIDSRGEYVFKSRPVTVTTVEIPVPKLSTPGISLAPQEVVRKDTMQLADDPATVIPPGSEWKLTRIQRRSTSFEGVSLDLCYFKDILIPLTAPSVDDADCVIHLYNIPLAKLADQWKRQEGGLGEEARNLNTAAAVDALRAMEANTSVAHNADPGTMGAATLTRVERPEDQFAEEGSQVSSQPATAMAKIAEFWLKWDANEDGILENILLVIDTESRKPIFYDYVRNVTPDGKRPFSVLRINPVDGRWYGVGSMQIYDQIQNIIDLQVNRWNFHSGGSGRTTFWNPDAVEGGETNPHLDLNSGGTYKLKENFTADQALSYVSLPEIKSEDLKKMLDLYNQMAMNMSGVQAANDANMAGLQSAKLATSIINIDKSGQEMFGLYLSHLEDGVADTINGTGEIAVVNMQDTERYDYREDDKARYGNLSRSAIGESHLKFHLILSKYKAEQDKTGLSRAIDFAMLYNSQVDPAAREATAPLFRQALREEGVKDVDSIIRTGRAPQEPPAGVAMDGTNPAPHGDETRQPDPEQYGAQMEGGMKGGLAQVG